MTARDLDAACAAWGMGHMGLSAWLARYKERTTGRREFTVREYADAVAAVRAALGDSTDYSKEGGDADAT